MRTEEFDYRLPQDRIAQRPVARGASRMLVVDRSTGALRHRRIAELPELLAAGDLLLLNDSRVIPARLEALRTSGRRFELLLLRELDSERWECLLRPAARARAGERLGLADGGGAMPEQRLGEGRWTVRFSPPMELERMERIGTTPLPPYIGRPNGPLPEDRGDYQTVYAAAPGAVAAPTAGLHFTHDLLEAIGKRAVEVAFVTLHVGLGTFRPVLVEEVERHSMHGEWYRISEESEVAINRALEEGRRIVCVGTTSVRALESALLAGDHRVRAGEACTDLFITPGFSFRGTGAMLTNFHLPRSTLLMMVSAFAGRESILAAYREAIRDEYRFFSYGDAMLIV